MRPGGAEADMRVRRAVSSISPCDSALRVVSLPATTRTISYWSSGMPIISQMIP